MRPYPTIALLLCCGLFGGCSTIPTTGNPVVSASRAKTDRALDLAIVGDGFFIVQLEKSSGFLFTRRGAMSVASNGEVVNEDGYRLYPPVLVGDANLITIATDGVVRTRFSDDGPTEVAGQVLLARFTNTAGLVVDGQYRMPSDKSGDPITGKPGSNGLGTLAVGELEK